MSEIASGFDKTQIVAEFAPMVKRVAYHLMARLPASVHVDDLIQVGLIGLLEAVENYDGDRGAQFETYAVQRVRGSMLDELRQADWLPRTMRKKLRTIETAINILQQRLGRQPSEEELAKEIDVPLAEYQDMLQDARGYQLLHYEDFQGSEDGDFFESYAEGGAPNPLEIMEDDRFRQVLTESIENLPEREKLVMGLYYDQELNLKEIGEVLGVSESRVCQLHSQAVARLRGRLKEWRD